jgi:hypothetical protein
MSEDTILAEAAWRKRWSRAVGKQQQAAQRRRSLAEESEQQRE